MDGIPESRESDGCLPILQLVPSTTLPPIYLFIFVCFSFPTFSPPFFSLFFSLSIFTPLMPLVAEPDSIVLILPLLKGAW